MASSDGYSVSLEAATPRLIAAVRARMPVTSVPAVFGRYLDQVYAASRAGLVQLDGQNVFFYRDAQGRRGEVDVAFGVGVTAEFSTAGSVEPFLLPTGEVATTTHWGSYAKLGAAHDAIIEWCRMNGRERTGVRWEVYGHWTDDESRLRTDVFYLLRPA